MIYLKRNQRLEDGRTATEAMAAFVAGCCEDDKSLGAFIDRDAVLVPAPGHAKRKSDTLWAVEELCRELVAARIGQTTLPILDRRVTVPKSAFADPGQRPNAQRHYETIGAQPLVKDPSAILIVDDVVTRGATLVGCYARVRELYPEASVRCFAPFHVVWEWPDRGAVETVVERIRGYSSGKTYRYTRADPSPPDWEFSQSVENAAE